MNITEYLKDNILFLDGGMGTLLQAAGLPNGTAPVTWNLENPDAIIKIHKDYYEAGSNVANTNTFGADIFHFSEEELRLIIPAAIANTRRAAQLADAPWEKYTALDISSLGHLLEPFGDLPFEEAVDAFKTTIKIGVECGVDLIFIETMNDAYETKAAVLAAKEVCDLPIFVSNAYGEDGKLMTGATPSAMAALLEGMGVTAFGCNCSLGPDQLSGVVDELLSVSSVPVIFEPNAGMPVLRNGKTEFDVTPDEFANSIAGKVREGVRIVGGCCGTTPEHIKKLKSSLEGVKPVAITDKGISCISSYTHTVVFDKEPILIGERLNPTGKKRLKQALKDEDFDYVLDEGLKQVEAGVKVLDVNVGTPEVNEPELLYRVIEKLQSVTNTPLQIDTSDPIAMEKALRVYNGKAMINSVNGKEEVMEAIFPLVKKYGGFVVCLTLDEDGIPETTEGRIAIANKIIDHASQYGIPKKDLIFDTLAMTISADTRAAFTTLNTLDYIKNTLGIHTSLGVSNISFGLPTRDMINGTFFAMAMTRGLSAAIMNPYSGEMMKTYHAFRALNDLDENCMDYIEFSGSYEERFGVSALPTAAAGSGSTSASVSSNGGIDNQMVTPLFESIKKGMKEKADALTREELDKGIEPLEVVNNQVIPALNAVGSDFENKKMFLPQLLMSAEAAKAAFGVVKEKNAVSAKEDSGNSSKQSNRNFVIATVKGDIHDIGKNIVSLLMENYGFTVSDLGRDVPPETIVDEVIRLDAPLCGLSALMTTTVPAMEDTIKLLRQKAPWCKVVVGGAVLTREYADEIGADAYAADAMATVRYAQEVCG